jgi:hypothetical protein
MHNQIQKVNNTQTRRNPKIAIPRHIIKLLQVKGKKTILKATKEKSHVIFKGNCSR